MTKKKGKKVIRYRRPLNINVGMIIFALIFVYLVFSVYTYIRRDKIQFYEVTEGNIVNDKNYSGMILREEVTEYADRTGYINYYIGEGKRAAVGAAVYSIDETGSVKALLEQNAGTGENLSKESLSDLKRQLTSYCLSYSDSNFSEIYDMEASLQAAVREYSNFYSIENLEDLTSQGGVNFQLVKTSRAGIVSYVVDSFEDLTPSDITESHFDKSNYSKSVTPAGEMLENGKPVYKMITSDLWSLVFPLTPEEAENYREKSTLSVSFPRKGLELTGSFSEFTGKDQKPYGKLDFDKYMVQFASDRFVDFEIKSETLAGLKIPVTSVTEKEFYLIPEDYLTKGGDTTDDGFNKGVYSDQGESVVFVPTEIFNYKDGYYYVEMDEEDGWNRGDYVVKPDSNDRYQIGPTASLRGVYNINKGYAVFKQIDIISENEEFYTVKKNMSYGLSVFDHIVLNADTVKEGDLIY